MRHQVEKGTFSYENKERTKREKLVRTKWAFHRFGALTVRNEETAVFWMIVWWNESTNRNE